MITVRWIGRSGGEDAVADQIVKDILQHDPEAQTRATLRIVFLRGFDLGIARAQVTKRFEHTPAEWNERLGGANPGKASRGTTL